MRFVVVVLLAGCVSYREARIDLRETASRLDAEELGVLDLDAALAAARGRNPELKRLRAEARAAGLDLPPFEAEASYESRDGMLDLMVDPLGLARIGPRGAAFRLAEARRFEALAAIVARERTLAADLAETFLVEEALRGRAAPEVTLDEEAHLAAGLASEGSAASVRAARAAARAEGIALEAERAGNLAKFRRLLGAGSGARVAIGELRRAGGDTPGLEPSAATLLLRPDLAEALARYGTADAELRVACRDQWPMLRVGSQITLDGGGLGGLVAVTLPVGAGRRARAAAERREAARHALEETLLRAQEEAEEARSMLSAFEERAAARAAAAAAMALEARAAQARLALEPEAFGEAADLAARAVGEAVEAREAALAAARGRAAFLRAWGWPLPRAASPESAAPVRAGGEER